MALELTDLCCSLNFNNTEVLIKAPEYYALVKNDFQMRQNANK